MCTRARNLGEVAGRMEIIRFVTAGSAAPRGGVAGGGRGTDQPIGVRADSAIDVPEPERALVLNSRAEICGYSICNDVSSRTIEGENPLYLPQAKIYLGGCALGPAIRPTWEISDPYA